MDEGGLYTITARGVAGVEGDESQQQPDVNTTFHRTATFKAR